MPICIAVLMILYVLRFDVPNIYLTMSAAERREHEKTTSFDLSG